MITEEQLARDLLAADQHLQHQEFDDAYKIYQVLVQQYQSPEIYNNAAICAYNLGLQAESLKLITHAIKIDPNNPWYLTQQAQFVSTSDFELANEIFQQALDLSDKTLTSNPDDQQLAIFHQIKSCYATFLFNYGCLCAQEPELDRQNQAIALFKKSLEYNTSLFKATYNIACCSINLDNINNALLYLHKTIELNPNHSQAHFALSQYYQQHNNITLAEEHLQKSLTSTSINQANAQYNYGVLEQKRNNYSKALEHYHRCCQLDPSHFAACYNSASIYHRLKDFDQAIKFYKQALAIKPEDTTCKYLLVSLSQQNCTQDSANKKSLITQAPHNYIENLFDSYAENFDHELVNNLEYKTPELLYNLLTTEVSLDKLSNLNILDLGCGTGLSGELFKKFSSNLTGVDLSRKMLDCANKKDIYNILIKADLDEFLLKNFHNLSANHSTNNKYDLIILSDVLVYYGDLTKLFHNIKNNLKSGGWLLFSLETITDAHSQNINSEFQLQINSRFAHSISYVKSVIDTTVLTLLSCESANLRKQDNTDVVGSLFLAIHS